MKKSALFIILTMLSTNFANAEICKDFDEDMNLIEYECGTSLAKAIENNKKKTKQEQKPITVQETPKQEPVPVVAEQQKTMSSPKNNSVQLFIGAGAGFKNINTNSDFIYNNPSLVSFKGASSTNGYGFSVLAGALVPTSQPELSVLGRVSFNSFSSEYKKHDFYQNNYYNYKLTLDGFSVFGDFGADYKLTKNFGLYAGVGFGYGNIKKTDDYVIYNNKDRIRGGLVTRETFNSLGMKLFIGTDVKLTNWFGVYVEPSLTYFNGNIVFTDITGGIKISF